MKITILAVLLLVYGCTTITVESPDGLKVRYSSSKDIKVSLDTNGVFKVEASASSPMAAAADAAIKLFNAGMEAARP
jgi:hypothetical protein